MRGSEWRGLTRAGPASWRVALVQRQQAMRAAVVGGGIAGLATAAALRRSGVAAVVYSETIVKVSGSPLDAVGPLGLGLWTNALRCLELLDPKALAALAAEGRWMGDASYRTRGGRWIAGPSRPLAAGCASGDPSMLFVSHQELQTTLESLLPASAIITHDSRVRRFESAEAGSTGLRLAFEDGSCSEDSYDLIVGADGRGSAVRQQLAVEASARELMQLTVGKRRLASGDMTPHALQNMGYVVFRGLAHLQSQQQQQQQPADAAAGVESREGAAEGGGSSGSFQSWGGDGRRFATVPMSEGRHSWFATVPVDSVESIDGFDWKEPLGWLQRSFADWHDPIPTLLASSPPELVTWESAVAHRLERGGAEAGDQLLDLDMAHRGPQGACGVALVGDAAHTHDPLLAQGAGRAIEAAVGLASTVERWRAEKTIGGVRSPLQSAIMEEAETQRQRDALLQVVGDVAASMGQAGKVARYVLVRTQFIYTTAPHRTAHGAYVQYYVVRVAEL
jgi:2-polyprenyl-6-methoxyphenol hydroxylase-like FAD-dependent oxidoreductase